MQIRKQVIIILIAREPMEGVELQINRLMEEYEVFAYSGGSALTPSSDHAATLSFLKTSTYEAVCPDRPEAT